MARRNHPHKPAYTLGTLFLLIAACGVLFGLLSPLVRGPDRAEPDELVIAAVAGGSLLALVGAILGLFQFARGRGVLWGICVGGALGVLYGPLILVPPEGFPSLLSTGFGGAVLIVALAAMVRWHSARRPPNESRREAGCPAPGRHPLDPNPP